MKHRPKQKPKKKSGWFYWHINGKRMYHLKRDQIKNPCIVFVVILILSIPSVVLPEINLDAYADAIYLAEGEKAVVPYGMFFDGCSWENPDYCRKIVKNTVFNTLVKYRSERCFINEDDVDCLARRYAPINDPRDIKGLNKNWAKNVRYFLTRGGK